MTGWTLAFRILVNMICLDTLHLFSILVTFLKIGREGCVQQDFHHFETFVVDVY